MTLDKFMNAANGAARSRTFYSYHYTDFRLAVRRARYAAARGRPYYWAIDAGGVARSYGHTTTSAVCGVWVEPVTLEVVTRVGRETISGPHVRCPRAGGERSYLAAWRGEVVVQAAATGSEAT